MKTRLLVAACFGLITLTEASQGAIKFRVSPALSIKRFNLETSTKRVQVPREFEDYSIKLHSQSIPDFQSSGFAVGIDISLLDSVGVIARLSRNTYGDENEGVLLGLTLGPRYTFFKRGFFSVAGQLELSAHQLDIARDESVFLSRVVDDKVESIDDLRETQKPYILPMGPALSFSIASPKINRFTVSLLWLKPFSEGRQKLEFQGIKVSSDFALSGQEYLVGYRKFL